MKLYITVGIVAAIMYACTYEFIKSEVDTLKLKADRHNTQVEEILKNG